MKFSNIIKLGAFLNALKPQRWKIMGIETPELIGTRNRKSRRHEYVHNLGRLNQCEGAHVLTHRSSSVFQSAHEKVLLWNERALLPTPQAGHALASTDFAF